jgi:negative regulator of flagellin synthesis FlgM
MKITNNLNSVTGGSGVDNTGRPGRKSSSDANSGTAGDSVQISALSSSLQAIEQRFSMTPVVDVAHVSEIKQAIANGQFKVDAGKVADRLLKTAQELIQAHQP